MSRRAVLAAAAACAMVPSASAQTGRPLPSAETFGSLPFISDPKLSPDGQHFAAIQSVDGRPAAAIYQVNAAAGAAPQVYASNNWIVDNIRWVKSDRLVIVTKTSFRVAGDTTGILRSLYRAMSVGVGDEEPVPLFSNSELVDSMAYNLAPTAVADADLDDPNRVYMSLWTIPTSERTKDDPGAVTGGIDPNFRNILYSVDVHTGRATEAMDGGLLCYQWILDGHGNVMARVDQLHSPLIDRLKIYSSGDWRDVKDFDATADRGAGIAGPTIDGRSLVFFDPKDRYDLGLIDLASGQASGQLFADPKFDASLALTDEWNGHVIGVGLAADKFEYKYFDPGREAVQRGVEAVFPGLESHAVSSTLDGSKMIIAVDGPRQPPAYYFLDRTSHQATKIASEYPSLQPEDLGEMRPYPFRARDELDIPAYLTLPPGRGGKNLPLVVMPHGGPDARDYVHFDWWAQFMANRGYAVFQPNYRGSAGYGRAFTSAGLHQWGLKMQDDITDGVKKLIADGIADPKRICIVGASYGGYAALAGATFTPDLYACAVSVSGVTDLPRMLAWERARTSKHSQTVSFWASRIGDAADDSARLEATSPALHADQVRKPILLMHETGDTTVPIEQGEEERDALHQAGKSVEFVELEGDDHYLRLAATRVRVLTEIEKFLNANIGG
jgi:dipeptidyl aminopeptidase/acylaminoacyl peptidase